MLLAVPRFRGVGFQPGACFLLQCGIPQFQPQDPGRFHLLVIRLAEEIVSVDIIDVAVAVVVPIVPRALPRIRPKDAVEVFVLQVDAAVQDGHHHGFAPGTVQDFGIRLIHTHTGDAVPDQIGMGPGFPLGFGELGHFRDHGVDIFHRSGYQLGCAAAA